MNLTPEQQQELGRFPESLRALVEAELAAGNAIEEIGHSHPAPPVGAYLKLTRQISTRPRASGSGLDFYDRHSSSYSGEFTDATRYFFVLEPSHPPPPEPDMDAIREAHEPKPDRLSQIAQRDAGSNVNRAPAQLHPATPPTQDPPQCKVVNREAPELAPSPGAPKSDPPTGWTRLLHFRDKRPPHEVQFALERELMVLFTATMQDGRLRLNASATVNGAPYQFELRFVAALPSDNCYSLRVATSWADADPLHHDYFRSTSDSWFRLWTRELMQTDPPAENEGSGSRYQDYCKAAFHAQSHLESVPAVQRVIIEGLKEGATFNRAHKEGGTKICWRNGKFIRSDYGDYPGTQEFTAEAEFLKMLWHFCQSDVTRNAGKQGLPELDAWKLILRRMTPVPPPHPDNLRGRGFGGGLGPGAIAGMAGLPPRLATANPLSLYSSPLAAGLIVALLVLLTLGLAAWHFLSIKSTGLPLGPAVRTPTHVFQLIRTTERYLPKLHRSPGSDRFRIELLSIPLAAPSSQETFTLLRQQTGSALTPVTQILGASGQVVWIQALDIFAVNLQTKHIARGADLRKANPELELFMASARSSFTDRFIAVSPDWSRAYEFSAETLKATACAPPPRSSWSEESLANRLESSLCSGGLISPTDWIAVATMEAAAKDLKPGFSLPRDFTANDKDHQRQIYRGRASTNEPRRRIETSEQLETTAYRAATFLRDKPGGTILRASDPESLFLLHRIGAELFAPFTLTRLPANANPIWNAPTGIGRLQQVLPGTDYIGLIGERTPVPNKVPEPILVLIDNTTGATTTISLWR